jgi:hypothetical protein
VRILRVLNVASLSNALVCGYKVASTFFVPSPDSIMSAKFYFYFFWHLKPLADREG